MSPRLVTGRNLHYLLPGLLDLHPSEVPTPNAGLSIPAESFNWGVTTVTVGSDVVFSFEDKDDKVRHVA